jgi:hypothetical protein
MAAAVHKLGPDIVSPAAPFPRANVFMVIRQALHWAGLFGGHVQACFERYDECPEITTFYDALVSSMPQGNAPEPLFEGAGNLRGEPRASPFFNHCRLTMRGWTIANELLDAHPHYRNDLRCGRCGYHLRGQLAAGCPEYGWGRAEDDGVMK